MKIEDIKKRVIARSKNSLANFVDLKQHSFRIMDLLEMDNYLGKPNWFCDLLENKTVSFNFLKKDINLKPNLTILKDYENDKIFSKNDKIDINDDINDYILWRKNEIYQKLLKLEKINKESLRETGIAHLKIGYPFISGSYYDENNKLDFFRAPLFFFNVSFERSNHKFSINWNQSIMPNVNLLSKLAFFLRIDLAPELAQLETDDEKISVFDNITNKYHLMINILQEKLNIKVPRTELDKDFILTPFPFKSETLTTLRKKGDIIDPILVQSALIGFYKIESAELIHDLDNWENSEQYFTELENQMGKKDLLDHNYDPIKAMENLNQISELDFSQKQAILAALRKNLVINGPPGTGKSQTIVNLLINILSNNKKALFCAEKKVATEVVYNRLRQFQHFALLIYDLKNDKKAFISQLRKSWHSLNGWSSRPLKVTNDISQQISELLSKISKFHQILATDDGKMYVADLTKYGGKIPSNIIEQVEDYQLFDNLLLSNSDEQVKQIEMYCHAHDYYNHVLKQSKIITDYSMFYNIMNFNWNVVPATEINKIIVQFYLTNKLKNKVSFWNKRKVNNYYNIKYLKTEFILFDEFINKYNYLGRVWIDNYSFTFNQEIKEVLNILQVNKLALKDLIKCVSLKKFENNHREILALEKINWKLEYKKVVKAKQQLDLENLHINYAKNAMEKIILLDKQDPKRFAKFLHLIDTGKRFPTLKKFMELYHDFIYEIFPIIISSIEGGITLFPNKRGSIDFMIFDEASQIFLERGISLMHRGKTVVIAGDNKQLQPSNFFAKNLDDDSLEDIDDVEEFKAGEYSSLLDFGMMFFEKEMLNYHYRSEHRELIEFSNKVFYDGKLLVCEKPLKKEKAIEIRDVKGKSFKQRNEIEANTVVNEVINILKTRQNNETIGIIAFNSRQAQLISDKLIKLNDPLVMLEMERRDNDVNKALFVKNLEEVQGDERDIIIFSVGFAKDEITNRLKRNFGPINKTNGENRINVAISRAIKKIIIVKSIAAADFGYDIDSLKEGAKVFADYIKYAETLQQQNLDNEVFQTIWNKYSISYLTDNHYHQMDSILEQEIYRKLKLQLDNKKYDIIPQVKQSGFAIDLGIKDKTTDNFVLAIECDGHAYHSKPMDRARDIWRQSILESRGWKFERISSLQWWKGNQQHAIDKVLKRLEGLELI